MHDRDKDEVRYPADPGQVVGRVARATVSDVDAAVDAARKAFPAWRDRQPEERAAILRRAAAILEERRFEMAATDGVREREALA